MGKATSSVEGPKGKQVDGPLVFVVEDDPSMRGALVSLLGSAGYVSQAFDSAQALLVDPRLHAASCFVCDVRLPQMSGFDLQAELRRRGHAMPVIFMTGHGDITMSVKAMKSGAIDFLPKPFRDQDLLDAVASAVAIDRSRRTSETGLTSLREHYETLSRREREVLNLVCAGLQNKQVAAELGLSEVTVKLHRGTLMRKMEAGSLAGLVRMVESLERDNERSSTLRSEARPFADER